MTRYITIQNKSKLTHGMKVVFANTFHEKFLGLMFRKMLTEDEGILLAEITESRFNTAIHMFFMNFNIGVVWMDSSWTVVDTAFAKRWYPFYMSRKPAKFTLEMHPSKLPDFSIGDQIAASIEN